MSEPRVEESLALLKRRFDRMLDPETNMTLWEEWWRDGTGRTGEFQKRTRSDAQTESGFPPALFGEHILGLRFTAPGMRVVEISVPDGGLDQMAGTVPVPGGTLSIEWSLKAGDLDVSIPPGTEARLLLPGAATPVVLTEGNHHVQF